MRSIWTQNIDIRKRDCLKENIETEVAVIGAGLAGILIAFQLQRAGKKVVVIEGNRIASGQTSHTTAKITSQHGLVYHRFIREVGEEKAKQYALANESAIDEYRKLIKEEKISCDFEEKCSYIFSDDEMELQEELEAVNQLGLSAELVRRLSIPISCTGAIRFDHQAQFHPIKFIKAISESLTVYENTPVTSVEGHRIKTKGGEVQAEKIVFATHFPFINFPGMYFARMHQERSYVLALKGIGQVDGMFLGEGKNAYSFRNYGDFLLFGGESHRTGENKDGGRYDALRKKAKELFPDSEEVAHWSAQDCITVDSIPYIGNYTSEKSDWYVATGFQKWGMSHSMVSAMILRDLICGNENPYSEVFDPSRFVTKDIKNIAKEGGMAVKGLVKRVFQLPEETAMGLPKGHGGVVELEEEKVGVYKDFDGKLYVVDIRCPHLGCQLEWNPDERSWDCPCHGSRFDYHGKLISNPAQEDIYLE